MHAGFGCRRGFLAALFAAALLTSSAYGEDGGEQFHERWRWTHFSTADGLPSNRIVQLIDVDGVPYVGTDAGFARYDGWRWEIIGEDHGLPAEAVESLAAAPNGTIWVSTSSGLFAGDGVRFEQVSLPDEFVREDVVVATAHSNDGDTFVQIAVKRTAKSVLLRRTGSAFARVEVPVDDDWGRDHATLVQVSPGRIWLIGSSDYFTWDNDSWVRRLHIGDHSSSFVQDLFENSAGSGVLGIREPMRFRGLYSWNEDYELTRLENEGRGIAKSIAIGPAGRVVVLYDTYELRYRVEGEWSSIAPLPEEFTGVTLMRFRPNGDLWVGTAHGLHLLRNSLRRWSRLYRPGFNDLRNRVNEILVDRDENLWLGNTIGVEVRNANLEDLDITLPIETVVTGLGEDEDGIIWVSSGSTMSGLFGWDHGRWLRVERDSLGRPLGVIHKIRADRSGGLWLLTLASDTINPETETGGVMQLVGGVAVPWAPGRELAERRLYDMLEDADGALWFATSRGISRYDGTVWAHWTTDHGLAYPGVFRIRPRAGGGIWMAQPNAGLGWIVFDGDATTIGYADLGNNASIGVWDVAPDGEHLWITTERGLQCLHEDGSVSRFEQVSGLRSPKAWPVLPRPERVLVGTMGGGTYLLDRSGAETPAPRVLLEALRDKDGSPLMKWRVASFWGEQAPAVVQTRYRVDGGEWSEYSIEHEVHLTELGSGDHQFEVHARGLFGSKGEIASTRVDVLVPIFRRFEFLVPIVALTTLLLVTGSVQYSRHRRDADALRHSEAEYRTLMEEASDAIIVSDRFGIVRNVNARACELLGPSETLIGRPMRWLVEDADVAGRLALTSSLDHSTPQVVSVRLKGNDGKPLPVEANVKRIDEDRVQAIVRDLSERRRLEEERLEFERQVMESQKLESLGRLAGGLAHDFNNLLMLILGHADQARQRVSADASERSDAIDSLDQVVKAAERAGELTQKLLAFAGKESIEPRAVDITTLVRELPDLLQASVSRGIHIQLELTDDLPRVEADPARLRQVVMNLVLNARDAIGDESGEITLRTSLVVASNLPEIDAQLDDLNRSQNVVAIEVVDSGEGMDAETKRRMFDPFFSTRFQGRGLGLAAVRGIVRSHRGAIRVESAPGEGSTITILLPTAPYTIPTGSVPTSTATEKTGDCVLVVDDDYGVRCVVASMLERAGFSTLVAASGAEGVDIYRKFRDRIACSIIDLTMPGMDGLATRDALVSLDPNAIVILMSGYNEEAARARSRAELSNVFLQKPFSAGELVAEVRAVTKEHPREESPPLREPK